MKTLVKTLRPALVSFIAMSLVCGLAYTGVVTGIAQALFAREANGSVITAKLKDGTIRAFGSALIAQEFMKPEYLIGRPMGASNLSPTSRKQKILIQERVDRWHAIDPENNADIPADLVTASGSGVDPYISLEAAEYQVSRIACARGMQEASVRSIIAVHANGRFLGIFGEPCVNVLEVNLALDGLL